MSRIVLARPVPSALFEKKTPPKKRRSFTRQERGGGGGGGGYRDRLTIQVQKCAWGELGATKTRRQWTTATITKATGTSSEYSGRNNTGGEWGGNTGGGGGEEMNNHTHTQPHTHTHTHTRTRTRTCILKADIVCH